MLLFGLTAGLILLLGIFFLVFPRYSIDAQTPGSSNNQNQGKTLIWSSADCDYLSTLTKDDDSSIKQFCAYVSGEYGYKTYKLADLNQPVSSPSGGKMYCVYADANADCRNLRQPLPYHLFFCDNSCKEPACQCYYGPREGLQSAIVNPPCCLAGPPGAGTDYPLKSCYTCLEDKKTKYDKQLIDSVTCLDGKEYPVNQDYYSSGECKSGSKCATEETECGTGTDSVCCDNETETCDANTKKCVSDCGGPLWNPCPACGPLNGQVVISAPSENDPNLCISGYSASDIISDNESLIVSWSCNNGKNSRYQYCSAMQKGLRCYIGPVFPAESTAKDPYKVYKGQAVEFIARYEGGDEPITYGWTSYSSRGGFWIQNKENCKVGSDDTCKVIAVGTGNVSMGAWAKDASGKSVGPAHCYVNISTIPVLKLKCDGKYMDSGNVMFTFSASGGDSSQKYDFSNNTVDINNGTPVAFEPPLNVGSPDEYITVLAKDVPDKGHLTASASVSSGDQKASATCSVPIEPTVRCQWVPNPARVTLGDTTWFEVVGIKGVAATDSAISYLWSVEGDDPGHPTPIQKHPSNPKVIGVAANKPGLLTINVIANVRDSSGRIVQAATGKCSSYVYEIKKRCGCGLISSVYYIDREDADGNRLASEICKDGYYCSVYDNPNAKCRPASSKLGFPLDGSKCSEAYNKKHELIGSPLTPDPLKVSCTDPTTSKTPHTNLITIGLGVEGGTQDYTYQLKDYTRKLLQKNSCQFGLDEFAFDDKTGGVTICNPTRAGSYNFTITVSDNSSPTLSETRSCTIDLTKGESGLTISKEPLGTGDSCKEVSDCSKMPPIQLGPEDSYKFCAADYASVFNATKAYACENKKCVVVTTVKILTGCSAASICEPYNYYDGEERKDSKCVVCETVRSIYSKKTTNAAHKEAIDTRCPVAAPLRVKCVVSLPKGTPFDSATNTYTLYQGERVTFSAQISGGSDANKTIADKDITWTGTACTGSDKVSITGQSCSGTAFKIGKFSATVKVNLGDNNLIESVCNVRVVEPPTLKVFCSNRTVTLGQNATLIAFPEGGTGEYNYYWWSSNKNVYIGNDKTLTGKPTKAGKYVYNIGVVSGIQTAKNRCTLTVVE